MSGLAPSSTARYRGFAQLEMEALSLERAAHGDAGERPSAAGLPVDEEVTLAPEVQAAAAEVRPERGREALAAREEHDRDAAEDVVHGRVAEQARRVGAGGAARRDHGDHLAQPQPAVEGARVNWEGEPAGGDLCFVASEGIAGVAIVEPLLAVADEEEGPAGAAATRPRATWSTGAGAAAGR